MSTDVMQVPDPRAIREAIIELFVRLLRGQIHR